MEDSYMKSLIIGFTLFFSMLGTVWANPCLKVNETIAQMSRLDVGDDANFRLIMQRNNQQLIRDCHMYQTQHIRRLQHQEQDYEHYTGYYNQQNPRN